MLAELEGLHDYVMDHYLVLYEPTDGNIHLLSLKHYLRLFFDFETHWSSRLSHLKEKFNP
jgi:hypothetical protein